MGTCSDKWHLDLVLVFMTIRTLISSWRSYPHEVKRCFLLGRKAMTNLGIVLKSRDITLPTSIYIVKTIVFLVMYEYESWAIKKAERQSIDAFELWC